MNEPAAYEKDGKWYFKHAEFPELIFGAYTTKERADTECKNFHRLMGIYPKFEKPKNVHIV